MTIKKNDDLLSMRTKGSLFVVSAPSGAGKTTLCKKISEQFDSIEHSVSYTTRKPRDGERNNVDYTFVSKEEFFRLADENEFLEWAEVHGNYYGTLKKRIEERRERGLDVIMDIDVQGARQLMEKGIDACFVFILPPTLQELSERLEKRKTETEEAIKVRLMKAKEEIGEYKKYDYVIINDIFKKAVDSLLSIIKSRKCSQSAIDHEWIEKKLLEEVY